MAESWTLGTITRQITKHFEQHNIDSARLDAELLVARVVQKSRTHLYINEHEPIDEPKLAELRPLVKRRAQHEPIAYILGEREFYGRRIEVSPDVLVPRPETELLIEAALAWLRYVRPSQPRVLDLCCGSGAISIALAHAWPDCVIVGADISAKALAVAERNVSAHGFGKRIELVEADLFEGRTPRAQAVLSAPFDIVLCNPPYVPLKDRDTLPVDVRSFEPHQALFAGDDGLDVLRRVCHEVKRHMNNPRFFATEMGFGQASAVTQILRPMWSGKCLLQDLNSIPRVAAVWEGTAFDGVITMSGLASRPSGRGAARLQQKADAEAKAHSEQQGAEQEPVFHVDQAPQGVATARGDTLADDTYADSPS